MTEVLDLQALMMTVEDLHPDLQRHIRTDAVFPMVHHPLVIDLPYSPAMNAIINKRYALKLTRLEEARAAREWHSYVFTHERPYRIDALNGLVLEGVMTDREKWELIAESWTDSENIYENIEIWQGLWSESGYARPYVMNNKELTALAQLPEEFQIWRGHSRGPSDEAMSWTTDREKAVWFARRFEGGEGRRPKLLTGTIRKSDVLAYFLGRGESEVVTFAHKIMGLKTERF